MKELLIFVLFVTGIVIFVIRRKKKQTTTTTTTSGGGNTYSVDTSKEPKKAQ